MHSQSKTIKDLNFIEEIEDLERLYRDSFGKDPYNVSLWNPSEKSLLALKKYHPFSCQKTKTTYYFPSDVESVLLEKVKTKLGLNRKAGTLITPSGSLSILSILYWIKTEKIRKVNIVSPRYFSVLNNCKVLEIKTEKISLKLNRERTGFKFPQKECEKIGKNEVLWLTNPVYCSGLYLDKNWIKNLKILMRKGVTVVLDECLAINGKEVSRQIGNIPNLIGIYSPHKSVCINSEKFSLIAFDSQYQDEFYQLSDTIFSCLGQSNIQAMRHFSSQNYDLYAEKFNDICERTMRNIRELFKNNKNVLFEKENYGYLTNCYLPNINANLGRDKKFLWRLMENTGSTLIPGIYNDYSEKLGFCFRVNLSRDEPLFYKSLKGIVDYIYSRDL